MSDLEKFAALDFKSGVLFLIAILVITVLIIQKWDWIVARFGIKTKRVLDEEKQINDIEALKNHANKSDQAMDKIVISIDEIHQSLSSLSAQVQKMQDRNDENERARIKDRVAQSYRIYHERKEWTVMEKEAFEDLVKAYEASGGKNSFIHTICEPESLTWIIIDN